MFRAQSFGHTVTMPHAFVYLMSGIYGKAVPFTQMANCLDMVGMVVGDEYTLYAFQIEHTVFEYFFDGTDTDAGINQYSGVVGSQVVAVTAASAGQTHESYFHLLFIFC